MSTAIKNAICYGAILLPILSVIIVYGIFGRRTMKNERAADKAVDVTEPVNAQLEQPRDDGLEAYFTKGDELLKPIKDAAKDLIGENLLE